jgi:hypothetical protein
MAEYESRVIKVVVLPKNQPIFSELATTIEIDDEAAGEYVRICQPTRDDKGTVCFDGGEWEAIKVEVDRMIGECRSVEEQID